MTGDQFQIQMNRLAEQFGKTAYGTERARLVWLEVKDFDVNWFARLCDSFLGYERQAPLLDRFAEAASKERERVYQIEKARNTRESEHAMNSIYSALDVQTICKNITSRVAGEMTDQDFAAFKKMLVVQGSNICLACGDSGAIVATHREHNTFHTFRCMCRAGHVDTRSYPRWSAEFKQTYDNGVIR